jgi:hypothetical protein
MAAIRPIVKRQTYSKDYGTEEVLKEEEHCDKIEQRHTTKRQKVINFKKDYYLILSIFRRNGLDATAYPWVRQFERRLFINF